MSRKMATSPRGFTLLELLLVVTILAVLAGLILPVVAGLRTKAKAVQCLSSMKQFAVALDLYTGDSEGSLPPNRMGIVPVGQTWVSGWVTPLSPDATNVSFLQKSLLARYLKTDSLWHCPGDTSKVLLGGMEYDRVRSISMNYYMGANWRSPTRLTFHRTADFDQVAPANIFTFTDERPETINDGAFVVDPAFNVNHQSDWRIIDLPGNFHGVGTGMAFADEHAEIHVWKDQRTTAASYPYQTMAFNWDMQWLDVHSSAPSAGK